MDDFEKKIALQERRLQREKRARKEAEQLLEQRSRELYEANTALKAANTHMEQQVADRTMALRLARDEALSANKAKSEFLSSMSHELRTPLNAIIGFSQLLAMDCDDDAEAENIAEIEKAGHHLLNLINEVLDLSKIESGKVSINLEEIALADVLADCRSLSESLAKRFNIKLIIDSSTDLTVFADSTRLKQVLSNLISNAIKYNRANGKVTVTVSKKDFSERVRIEVEDTGPGIADDKHEQLFEAFNRIGAENSGIEGTGIGLMITRQLVEMMGGEIGLTSEVGVGSCFWVDIPAHAMLDDNLDEQQEQQEQSETALASCAESIEQEQSMLHTVLYVEDNPANLRLVERIFLRMENIRLQATMDASTGLEMIAEQKPDLLLLDINLPGMSGIEMLQELKKHSQTADIPSIAISADAMQANIDEALAAGFDHYLTKPLNVKELQTLVYSYLD